MQREALLAQVVEGTRITDGHAQAAAGDKIARQLTGDDLEVVLELLKHEDEQVVRMVACVLTSNSLVNVFGDTPAFMAMMRGLCEVIGRGRPLASFQAVETIYNWAIIKPFDISGAQLQQVRTMIEQAIEATADQDNKDYLGDSLRFLKG